MRLNEPGANSRGIRPDDMARVDGRVWPWLVLALLLALCLGHGLRVTAGLALPPDPDALRDIGFAQGFLDGNWFGDPAYANTRRYYPPLISALAALAIRLGGVEDIPRFWVLAGPFLGLVPVAAFFSFMWRLAGPAAAACGTAVFVLANSATADPWVGGGYSPWILVPLLAQAGFLATATLILSRAAKADWREAPVLGAAIGLTFLAHPVPGMLLGAMLAATLCRAPGIGRRAMVFLALAGATAACFASFFLLPLILSHPAGIVHRAPGAWVAGALDGQHIDHASIAVEHGPWLLALAVLVRRRWFPSGAWPLLAAWMGICLVELGRHALCGPADSMVCRVGRVPVHHYHLYLQIAGACLAGAALPELAKWLPGPPRRRQAVLACAGTIALTAGGMALLSRDYDWRVHALARDHADAIVMDLGVYRWILRETPPGAVFATFRDGGTDGAFDPANFATMAAGRRLVATHSLFSNPYTDWTSREATRAAIAAWLTGEGPPPSSAPVPWAIAPRDTPVRADRATQVHETAKHRIFAIHPWPISRPMLGN